MRVFPSPAVVALLSALLDPFVTASIDCHHIRVDKVGFDLSKLGGPRSALHSVDQVISLKNTTYTIDICKPLTRDSGVPKNDQCPNGTRVCAIERLLNKEDKSDTLERVIPIAGDLKDQGGGHLDPKWERLKSSSSHSDSELEGLRVELNGGYLGEGKDKRAQKAIVEFICDKTRTGLEHLWDPEDRYVNEKRKREDTEPGDEKDGDNDKVDDNESSSLEWVRYEAGSGDVDVLRLKWRTKYACESSKQEEDEKSSASWGFFTWFILIAFLSTATYLIFGSWLNYNRYGARGWDLVPHGDTIRDVPYLLKDWSRRVVNTVQGPGSRGGYAAV